MKNKMFSLIVHTKKSHHKIIYSICFFKRFIYLSISRETGREREKEGEKHQCVVASHTPTRNPACNPGTCPDWELNWRPFGSEASAQSTEPHQPGLNMFTSSNNK